MCLAAAAVEMISEETAAGRDTAGAGVGGCRSASFLNGALDTKSGLRLFGIYPLSLTGDWFDGGAT